jgi:hypothetical protein
MRVSRPAPCGRPKDMRPSMPKHEFQPRPFSYVGNCVGRVLEEVSVGSLVQRFSDSDVLGQKETLQAGQADPALAGLGNAGDAQQEVTCFKN